MDSPARAVTEQSREARRVVGRRDQHDLADPGQQQRGERVIDHRLVVDRQQLLGDDLRHRVEPSPGTARQDDALARVHWWTPTLAASLANSAAALPPNAGAQFAPWGGPAALMGEPPHSPRPYS